MSYSKRAFALVILLCSSVAQAQVPQSINYQGYLTDSTGAAIDGSLSVTFAIYTVDTGGTPLWSDTRSVAIDSGLFTVDLGGAAAPFPASLFETPLWMGIAVDGDPEMAPRRALTTAAFSFKADDALKLQGQDPASFDQSVAVADLDTRLSTVEARTVSSGTYSPTWVTTSGFTSDPTSLTAVYSRVGDVVTVVARFGGAGPGYAGGTNSATLTVPPGLAVANIPGGSLVSGVFSSDWYRNASQASTGIVAYNNSTTVLLKMNDSLAGIAGSYCSFTYVTNAP